MTASVSVPRATPPGDLARPVRVLVVDDSAYMRHVISKSLNSAAGLTVVAAARDGREALELISRLAPDVVTLDVEMPRLDGLSTLREIMATQPLPVVMLSSLTTQGASETVQALAAGAVDFVAKPTIKANVAAVMDEVIAKVRLAAAARVRPPARSLAHLPAPTTMSTRGPETTRRLRPGGRDKAVVIGASTGGPRALHTVVQGLAASLPAAIVIVQHMPAGFTHSLAERLNALGSLRVKEAEPGDCLEVGRALLAPGGFHLTIDHNDQVALNQNPTVHGVRPAIDVTMSSVAQQYGAATIGVVLTGMGHDGTSGAALIHSAGGYVVAEAAATCVVWGMPRSVEEAGLADAVVPLEEVAGAVQRAALA